jgi:uroporphyrinogen-III synthase
MRLLIIRPQPGNDASARRASKAGFEPVQLPFFKIASRRWKAPDQTHYDALLFTSANAVRHAGPGLQRYLALPVHAVGRQTAMALHSLGIEAATTGTSGASAALMNAAQLGHHRLLWLTGDDHIDLTPPLLSSIETRICYASEALPISDGFGARIASADIVAFHSARAARYFCDALAKLGLDRNSLMAAAFSPAIAAVAGTGWRAITVASEPSDSALLSALAELVKHPAFTATHEENK